MARRGDTTRPIVICLGLARHRLNTPTMSNWPSRDGSTSRVVRHMPWWTALPTYSRRWEELYRPDCQPAVAFYSLRSAAHASRCPVTHSRTYSSRLTMLNRRGHRP